MTTLQTHNNFYTTANARKEIAADTLAQLVGRATITQERASDLEKAREIAQCVLLLTQGRVKTAIEEIVTLALSTVYPELSFELEYEIKRNQSEATPWIVENDERHSPRDEVGGGVLDIVSLGLRLALWALMEPKPANIFILDEPAKFLSRDKQPLFGEMLSQLSKTLGVQILIVSHNNAIIDSADKVYKISQSDGISIAAEYTVNELV